MINMDLIDFKIDDIEFWGEHSGNKGGMRILWSASIGWGQLDIVKQKDGTFIADTEHMDSQEDKAFTKKLLQLLLEKVTVI